MGEFLVTHDSGNSIQYIENSQFIKSSFRDSTIVAAKQVRLQKVLERHEHNCSKWLETIGTIKTLRSNKSKSSIKFARDPSRTRFSEVSPVALTLVERSVDFKYDRDGILRQSTKGVAGHLCENKSKKADLDHFITRKNDFYQKCHQADVLYNPVNKRQAVIFSTNPAKLEVRRAHDQ